MVALCTLLFGVGVVRAVEPPVQPSLYLPQVSQAQTVSSAYATWSSPIAFSEPDQSVWVVNPDSGSLTRIDGEGLAKAGEVYIGGEPWSVAVSHDGSTVYVADRAQGQLSKVDSATLSVIDSTFVGNEIGALVLSADGLRVYLSLMAEAAVAVVESASLEVVTKIDVAATPYALALSGPTAQGAHEKLYVTHLFGLPVAGTEEAEDNSREGRVTIIDTTAMQTIDEIILPPNEHGFANLMESIALQAGVAWIPHVRASPALPNGMTTTVFAAVSTLDLTRNVEQPAAALHLNDQIVFGSPVNNPAAVVPSPDGKMLYLVHGGSDLIEIVEISNPKKPRLVKFLATGKNPRGIALSSDGSRAYIMNYLSRTVGVYDIREESLIAEIAVTGETLNSDVLAGKILFHNGTDPRLTRGGWISCASCHFQGWPDGVTWNFPDGPRQTPMFWNAAQTFPWHWSAALDEAQDVEETIRVIQHGLGLASGQGLSTLGTPLAGQSEALDQLATFLMQGIRPANVISDTNGTHGSALFISQGCNACHGGATWTTSALPGVAGSLDDDHDGMVNDVLHDVGTYTERDVRGEGGFDVPSLLGVGLTAPYFHDGSASSLEELIRSGHPNPQGNLPPLEATHIAALVDFLHSIGPDSEAIPVSSNSVPPPSQSTR